MNHLRQLAKEIENIFDTRECLACQTFLRSIVRKAQGFGFHAEEAMDIAHETLSTLLMQAWNQDLCYQTSLKAFAHGIHRNLCLNRLRQKLSQKYGNGAVHYAFDETFHHVRDAALHHWDPLKILKKDEKRRLVAEWIEKLSHEDYRAVLTLRLKGYKRREISKKLNLPLKRIDGILNYGQKKLAALARAHRK